jgi:hypothetical protein
MCRRATTVPVSLFRHASRRTAVPDGGGVDALSPSRDRRRHAGRDRFRAFLPISPLSKERLMQLFKTEMMFMHPPRTRPIGDARSKRVLRYGRGLPLRTEDSCALPPLTNRKPYAETDREDAMPLHPFDVDRAA